MAINYVSDCRSSTTFSTTSKELRLTKHRRDKIEFFCKYSKRVPNNFGCLNGDKWIEFLTKFIGSPSVDDTIVRWWLQKFPKLTMAILTPSPSPRSFRRLKKEGLSNNSERPKNMVKWNTEKYPQSWYKLFYKLVLEGGPLTIKISHYTSGGSIKNCKAVKDKYLISATCSENKAAGYSEWLMNNCHSRYPAALPNDDGIVTSILSEMEASVTMKPIGDSNLSENGMGCLNHRRPNSLLIHGLLHDQELTKRNIPKIGKSKNFKFPAEENACRPNLEYMKSFPDVTASEEHTRTIL